MNPNYLVFGQRQEDLCAADSVVSDEPVNFIDYVHGFWHKICGRHSKQNLERFQVRMKYFNEYCETANIRTE